MAEHLHDPRRRFTLTPGDIRLPNPPTPAPAQCSIANGMQKSPKRFTVTLLPQLGLDFHKNKTFCVFNPLIFRTGIFRFIPAEDGVA
jgi:hypothetical protein